MMVYGLVIGFRGVYKYHSNYQVLQHISSAIPYLAISSLPLFLLKKSYQLYISPPQTIEAATDGNSGSYFLGEFHYHNSSES